MKTKRFLLFLLVIALVLVAPIATHADPPDDECPSPFSSNGHHTYQITDRGEPTCTEDGYITWTCADCNKVYTEPIPAPGHTWDNGIVTTAATCAAEGVKTFTCMLCGATRTEAIPKMAHTPVALPAKAATCTEAGLTEGSQCSTCGAVLTAQQTVPALGHSWDGGVITKEPQGFTPGEKTFTCTRCGTSFYKPVDPTQSVFSGMSNAIPDFSGGVWLMNNPVDPLHITQQPQGGFASGDGPLMLTVAAAGGEGAYVYNWYREPAFAGMSTSVIADIVTAQGTAIAANVQAIQNSTTSGLSELNQAWIDQHKIPGVTIAKPSTATEMETMTMNAQPFNPCQEFLGTSADPTCNGWSGYRYWCVVEDEAGHKAVSDKAEVGEGLYIARQPESKNIYGRDSVALTCVAAGGSGPEHQLYNWFDSAGKLLSDESTYMATTTGNYYCKVFDFGTDEVVDAEMARVYYEQVDLRPVITLQPESVKLEYREDGQYSWSMSCLAQAFDGSSENLKYEWFAKTDYGWPPIGSGEVLNKSYKSGTYRCKVTDTRNGASICSDEATVKTKFDCKITGQAKKSYAYTDLTCEIKDGNAPYEVKLYQVRIIGMKLNKETNAYDYDKVRINVDSLIVNQDGEFSFTSCLADYDWVAIMDTDWTNGEPILQTGHMEYVIVATDDNGVVSESDVFQTR